MYAYGLPRQQVLYHPKPACCQRQKDARLAALATLRRFGLLLLMLQMQSTVKAGNRGTQVFEHVKATLVSLQLHAGTCGWPASCRAAM